MLTLKAGIEKTFKTINSYLDSWKSYKLLWKLDKEKTIERFARRNPSIVLYDAKLSGYSQLVQVCSFVPIFNLFAKWLHAGH